MSSLLRKEARVEERPKVKTRGKELYILKIRILLALSIYCRRAGLYRRYKSVIQHPGLRKSSGDPSGDAQK